MVTTTELVKAFINSHHGWAVADQFQNTFEDGDSFEDQNMNALNYIYRAVKDLINSGLLSEETVMELDSYENELSMYLIGVK